MNKNSFFIRHQTSTLIIVVVVFVTAGLLIWIGTMKNNGIGGNNKSSTKNGLTEAQIQTFISDTPQGPPISPAERSAFLKEQPNGSQAITQQQRDKFLEEYPK